MRFWLCIYRAHQMWPACDCTAAWLGHAQAGCGLSGIVCVVLVFASSVVCFVAGCCCLVCWPRCPAQFELRTAFALLHVQLGVAGAKGHDMLGCRCTQGSWLPGPRLGALCSLFCKFTHILFICPLMTPCLVSSVHASSASGHESWVRVCACVFRCCGVV